MRFFHKSSVTSLKILKICSCHIEKWGGGGVGWVYNLFSIIFIFKVSSFFLWRQFSVHVHLRLQVSNHTCASCIPDRDQLPNSQKCSWLEMKMSTEKSSAVKLHRHHSAQRRSSFQVREQEANHIFFCGVFPFFMHFKKFLAALALRFIFDTVVSNKCKNFVQQEAIINWLLVLKLQIRKWKCLFFLMM